jgi:putative ABC transport system permease protein
VGGALAGALLPALDLSRRDPRSLLAAYTLRERVGQAAWPLFGLGWLVLAASWGGWRLLAGHWKPAGFAAGVGLLVGLPMLAPLTVRELTRRLAPRRFGLLYGVQALGARLQASSFAVAALAVAVSMLVGTTLMIGSFRRTVEVWLDASARADVYVTSKSWRRARESATLAPEIVQALASYPGVRLADRLRQIFVYTGTRRIVLGAADLGLPIRDRMEMLAGDRSEALRRAHSEGAVLISEPLARKAGLALGDALPIATPAGEAALPIAGIYYDYSSERGSAVIDLATMERLFGPGPMHSVALYLAPGLDPEVTVGELRERFAAVPLEIRSHRGLREQIFALFDQTFAVTRLLEAMSLVIASAGITLTLLVLARERVSELALYRALGAQRRQILRVFMGKGLGLALFGLALGVLGGVALAVVLIYAINRPYFGWTIVWHWPWRALVAEVLTILGAALAASLYPALRASRTPAMELSRENL